MDGYGIMNQAASRWVLLLRGIVGVVFGIMAIMSPGIGLLALALLFGFYEVIEGGLAVYLGFSLKQYWMALAGLLSIAVGIIAFALPMFTTLVLLSLAAVWAVVMGGVHLYQAIVHRREGGIDWMLLLAGAAGILLGGMLLAHPGWGLLSIALFVGIYALISGIAYIIISFNLRGYRGGHARPATA
ncbi:MAG TPA: DUF308 domain-containing protein [Fibrobacteria bacterium]|nr:DUF308 domain-containing protein [Fibrobacteria bacterium]